MKVRSFVRSAAVSGLGSRFVCILIFGLSTSTAFAKPLAPLSPAEAASRASTIQHLPWNGKSANKGISEESGCLMREETIQVDDPASKTSLNYTLLVQYPKSAQPLPVVIIVPTIRGVQEYLEPQVARSLCNSGFASIIADVNDFRDPLVFPSWGAEDVSNRKAILAAETVVDFAQSIPQFDKNKIGALGLSLGGITTALWTGLDPRLKASVIVVGGGNLPYILSHSDEPNVVGLREKRMAAASLTSVDEYDTILRANITLDPFYFASQANRHRIMMVMAEADTKVPFEVQKEQFNAFGQPQSITFTGGHVVTIVEMVYFYMDDVATFFTQKFNMPEAKTPAKSSSQAKAKSPIKSTIKTKTAPHSFLEPLPHKIIDLDKLGY